MRNLFPGTGRILVCLLVLIPIASAQSRTPEDLMSQVLKALETKDESAMKAAAITNDEVKKFIWPAVAQNISGNGMNADKFSARYAETSGLGLSTVFADFGGHSWQLVKVAMEPAQKQSKSYRLFPAPLLTIRDEGGQERTIRLVGGILEQAGTYKVSTYYVTSGKK